jgi:RimJ/RimL family protein N-acetyltransferase
MPNKSQQARAYFLRSARLGFSTWAVEDLPLAIGLWEDPEVTKLTGGPFTRAQVSERLAHELANFRQFGLQYWPIFLLETGEHVGCCGLQPHDLANGVCELGFQLCRVFWRRGFGREAAQAAITYGFSALGVRALYAGHHPSNDASRRLLQGLGFRYTHDEFYPPTKRLEPCYLLTREQSRFA